MSIRLFNLLSILLLVISLCSCGPADVSGGAEDGLIPAPGAFPDENKPADVAGNEEMISNAGDREEMKSAQLTLKISDFDKARQAVRDFTIQNKGYLVRSEQKGENPEKLTGTLVIRVPSATYDDTLVFLRDMGKLYELSEQAEEVSQQLFDLEARLRNARILEKRILSILSDQTGNIHDVVDAERELAQVRSRIEEMESRLKGLRGKVDYARFTIHLFVSGSKEVEIRAWYGPLLQDLRDLGFVIAGSLGILITVIVAVLPWLLLLWFIRRRWIARRGKKKKATPQ